MDECVISRNGSREFAFESNGFGLDEGMACQEGCDGRLA